MFYTSALCAFLGPFAYMLDAYTDDVECGTTLHYVLLAVGLVLALSRRAWKALLVTF